MSRLLFLTFLAFSFIPAQAATKRKKPALPTAPAAKNTVTHLSSSVGRRNVLLIIVDDLNADVGWMGGPVPTPNMDRLAHQGMRFTNAHAPHVLGHASRIAMFTGLLPSTSGVYTGEQDWRQSIQLKGRLTLPEFFMGAGYTTAAGGSIFESSHFGPGSLEHEAIWETRLPGITTPETQHVNGLDLWDWGALTVSDEETADGKTAAWAADYLGQAKAKKLFFLTVAIDKPHAPWYAPKAYFDGLTGDALQLPQVKDDDFQDVPDYAKEDLIAADSAHSQIVAGKAWPDAVRAYRACVAFADAQVGQVMAALEKSPEAKTTVVCLVSTRGMALGDKHCWQGGSLWACSTHVPLTILAPGVTHEDSVSDEPVSATDLFPTLAELTRQDVPKGLDGSSLVPLLLDPAARRLKPAITTMGGGEQASYAARTVGWSYIRNADGSEEMYDRAADPHEWTNVAGSPEQKETKQVLAQFLPKEWHSADRTAQTFAGRQGADGAIIYELQSGDKLPANLAPAIASRGMDVEVDFDCSGNEDGTLVAQGDARNGWALQLTAGQPVATLILDGHASVLTTAAPVKGPIRLRLFVPGNGTMSLGVAGQNQITGQSPFQAGFPVQPAGELSVGAPFAGLPESKAFTGALSHVWVTVLPP
ncbi:MAG: Arylsulfatase [Verrucomicrobiaceae bacterium]|nr:Arylsulfatase [Verrucomicrobiaceae bacterium]